MEIKTYDALKEHMFKILKNMQHDVEHCQDPVQKEYLRQKRSAIHEMVEMAGLMDEFLSQKSYVFSEDNFIAQNLEFCPNADQKVLKFISDFLTVNGTDSASIEAIRYTFRAGYCYYFAHMLKRAFRRGEVCWAAPFGHMVWVDEDNIPYDIEGVYSGEAEPFVPEHMLGDTVDDFLHVEGADHHTTEEELNAILQKYNNG